MTCCDCCDFDEICPQCGHEQTTETCLLGVLGCLIHLRCRACGMQWNRPDHTPEEINAGV